jgi:hypothetical protein
MNYRKKPVVVQAFQWIGTFPADVDWVDEALKRGDLKLIGANLYVPVNDSEEWIFANLGDWIIRGVKGDLYPCPNDVFEMTYETPENPAPEPGVASLGYQCPARPYWPDDARCDAACHHGCLAEVWAVVEAARDLIDRAAGLVPGSGRTVSLQPLIDVLKPLLPAWEQPPGECHSGEKASQAGILSDRWLRNPSEGE